MTYNDYTNTQFKIISEISLSPSAWVSSLISVDMNKMRHQ